MSPLVGPALSVPRMPHPKLRAITVPGASGTVSVEMALNKMVPATSVSQMSLLVGPALSVQRMPHPTQRVMTVLGAFGIATVIKVTSKMEIQIPVFLQNQLSPLVGLLLLVLPTQCQSPVATTVHGVPGTAFVIPAIGEYAIHKLTVSQLMTPSHYGVLPHSAVQLGHLPQLKAKTVPGASGTVNALKVTSKMEIQIHVCCVRTLCAHKGQVGVAIPKLTIHVALMTANILVNFFLATNPKHYNVLVNIYSLRSLVIELMSVTSPNRYPTDHFFTSY